MSRKAARSWIDREVIIVILSFASGLPSYFSKLKMSGYANSYPPLPL